MPGSFVGPDGALDQTEYLYFSYTTMTTLGYGDITPATPLAAILSSLEAVTGLLDVAVMIARLVTMFRD